MYFKDKCQKKGNVVEKKEKFKIFGKSKNLKSGILTLSFIKTETKLKMKP